MRHSPFLRIKTHSLTWRKISVCEINELVKVHVNKLAFLAKKLLNVFNYALIPREKIDFFVTCLAAWLVLYI